jgi:hypothetical protein
MNPEELYFALGRVIEEQPDYEDLNKLMRWLGKARALVSETSPLDAAEISAATTVRLHSDPWMLRNITIAVLYRALAVAELNAPVSAQGSFIPAGNALDAMASVGKVLRSATNTAMIIDPYMDEKTLTDFSPLASENVQICLMADAATAKATLAPAVTRFRQQFGSTRPLDARVAAPKALHDRLIIIDQTTVFTVTQSFNALASRSPASILRVDPETAALKINAYMDLWSSAKAI